MSEVTVAGRLGAVVRSALTELGVSVDRPTYVVEIAVADADALWQAIGLLTQRGARPTLLRPVRASVTASVRGENS